jgi:hypothetical protein
VFPSASVRYANRDDFLTGVGAKAAGERWNPPASFATVYTSLTPETATVEALEHYRHFHLPVEKALPRVPHLGKCCRHDPNGRLFFNALP